MGVITNNRNMRILISLLVLTSSKAHLFKANLHLEEEGTYYDQTEVYDPETADVITIVPAHERQGLHLEELKKIENEGLGISILDDLCATLVMADDQCVSFKFSDVQAREHFATC